MSSKQKPVAPQQPTSPAAPVVALRGGIAISHVVLGAAQYRTKAPHNQVWWQAIVAAVKAANGPAAVQPLIQNPSNPQGVPAAFFGYCVRRGYLLSVTASQQAAQ